MLERKYKERTPEETVSNIKNELNKLGLRVEESIGDSKVGKLHWLGLKLFYKGTILTRCNGKGTTEEYAKASAYAELMERIQNKAIHSEVAACFDSEFIESVSADVGFFYAPDEKLMSYKELAEEDLLQENPSFDSGFKKRKAEAFFRSHWHGDDMYLRAVPYYNLKTGEPKYISPWVRLISLYTNGFAAGNTVEEATNQGLSEIAERYYQLQLMEGKAKPKELTDEFLSDYPELYSAITEIREKGYQLRILDGSISGLPVISSLLINPRTMQYSINNGCFPVFEIAMERCLTELFQGESLDSIFDSTPSPFPYLETDKKENYSQLLANGNAWYAEQLLFTEKADKLNRPEVFAKREAGNQDILSHWLNLLEGFGCNIYFRNTTFTGLKTVALIVPELMFPFIFEEGSALKDKYRIMNRFVKRIMEGNASALLSDEAFQEADILQYLNYPINQHFFWLYEVEAVGKRTMLDFLGLLYGYVRGDDGVVVEHYHRIIKDEEFLSALGENRAGILNAAYYVSMYRASGRYQEPEIFDMLTSLGGQESSYPSILKDHERFMEEMLINLVLSEDALQHKKNKEDYIRIINRRIQESDFCPEVFPNHDYAV